MKNFHRAVASVIFVILSMVAYGDWAKVRQEFRAEKNHDTAVNKLASVDPNSELDLSELIAKYQQAKKTSEKDKAYEEIGNYLSCQSLSESIAPVSSAKTKIEKIKKDPMYRTQKEAESSNWMQKLIDRLKNLFNRKESQQSQPNAEIPSWVGSLVKGIFWILVACAIAALIYVIVKLPWGSFTSRTKRKSNVGMLEEGEVLLSEDEYLLNAERLIAEGKFREACRALYLATLLRIDAARIARFEPTQTNWEHLRRIESSATRPETFQFRPATKAFDLAWYGYRARSAADVEIFRETYIQIKSLTEVKR